MSFAMWFLPQIHVVPEVSVNFVATVTIAPESNMAL